MNFVQKFIEDLGYKEYAYAGEVSVHTDKIGYYHLIIKNNDFKINLQLWESHNTTHYISFQPTPGHKISSREIEFLEALRGSDTAKLWEDINNMKKVLYDSLKKVTYKDNKKYGKHIDFDKFKKGVINTPVFGEHNDDFYCDVFESTGQDLLGVIFLDPLDEKRAIGEGTLEYWKEMTGREDLYLDVNWEYIHSK